MVYEKLSDLIDLKNRAGLNAHSPLREVPDRMGPPYSTVVGWLNGFALFPA